MNERSKADSYLGTSISGWGRSVLLALIALGLDGRKIFLDCELDPDEQGRALVRNPVSKMQYVWQAAEEAVEDKNILAMQIVTYLNASSIHALGFGLYASSSIKEFFQRLCRYREIISSSVNMNHTEDLRNFHFIIEDRRAVRNYLTGVVFILFVLKICREIGGPKLSPIQLNVPWKKNEYDRAIREYTDTEIKYGHPRYELIFRREVAEKQLPSAQSQLASLQDKLCQDYLHSLDENRHLVSRVRLKIIQGLSNGNAHISIVASSLHMSARTLQRKLNTEGTSFRSILQQSRMELVAEYVSNEDLNATQITYMLGFSGPAQFSSAFKSWFGETFSAHRERLLTGT